ncbi:MAG: GGDEF domain-containing protein [Quadrisphaera sp.]
MRSVRAVLPRRLRRAERSGLVLLGLMLLCATSATTAALASRVAGGEIAASSPVYLVTAVGWLAVAAAIAAVLGVRGRLDPDTALAVLVAGSLVTTSNGVLVADTVSRTICLTALPVALVLAVVHVRGWRLRVLQAMTVAGALAVVARMDLPGGFALYASWSEAALVVIPSAVVASLCDRLDRARAEAERTARTDPLTGLLNRHGLAQRGPGLLSAAVAADHRVAVLLLDLDHFKHVNDTWGHGAGDRLLRSVAAAVTAEVRQCDAVVRWGGEEVAVVTHVVDDEQLAVLGERLRCAVADLLVSDLPPVTASIGTASTSTGEAARALGDDDAEEASHELVRQLLDRADAALYAAEAGGRDRVVHEASAGPPPPVEPAPPSTPGPRTAVPAQRTAQPSPS